MFAIDEFRGASARTQTALAAQEAVRSAAPTAAGERARERQHTTVREAIDDANDVIVGPFAGVTSGTTSTWARRGVPAVLALLFFGVGLGFLARFARAIPRRCEPRPRKV